MTSGYRFGPLLARGGTGVVHLATDRLGREVAVKRLALTGTAAEIETARRRIRREAEMLAAVDHPSIVPLLAVEDDGPDLLLVMPYLPGGSLADHVRRFGPMAPSGLDRLAPPLLDAVAAAHARGIVHRDISPGNILFDAGGRPVLADFGVATSRVHTAGLTRAGWTIGTPGFMSPEQARGEPAGPASDVFGLGACLYFALTGESPFGAGSSELLGWRSARGEIAPVPAPVPPPMATLLGAMLDPDPARRPSPAPLRTFEIDHGHAVVDLKRTGPGAWVWALAVAVVAAVLLAGSLLAASPSARKGAGVASATAAAPPAKPTPTTVPPCRPLPYQPCGATLPAAFTDGTRCVGGHGDYDGDPTDGCEAQPDLVDGAELRPGHPLAANLVPADDVDTYRTYVTDHFQLFCDGTFTVRLTAPPATTDRLEVLRDDAVVATALSSDGQPASARVDDPSCAHDNSGWLTVRVSPVAGRSAADYRLERSGGF